MRWHKPAQISAYKVLFCIVHKRVYPECGFLSVCRAEPYRNERVWKHSSMVRKSIELHSEQPCMACEDVHRLLTFFSAHVTTLFLKFSPCFLHNTSLANSLVRPLARASLSNSPSPPVLPPDIMLLAPTANIDHELCQKGLVLPKRAGWGCGARRSSIGGNVDGPL